MTPTAPTAWDKSDRDKRRSRDGPTLDDLDDLDDLDGKKSRPDPLTGGGIGGIMTMLPERGSRKG